MNAPTLPPWSNEGLSCSLADAARNERASALNLPTVFVLLEQLDAAFRCALGAVERDVDLVKAAPCFFLVRAYSCCFAAIRLALSGQVIEAHMPLRSAIEAAWYALHIFADPEPFNRLETWGHRDDSHAAKKRCKEEFTIGRVRRTHEELDPEVAEIVHRLYEGTIDFGGHPNHQSIVGMLKATETPQSIKHDMAMLTTDGLPIVSTLERVVDIGIGSLKTFQLIFAEEFRTARLALTIDPLISAKAATFRAWADRHAPSTSLRK